MAIETSTSLDDVKTKLDAKDGKVTDRDILQKLQDKQTVRDFFYVGSNTLRSYLEKNDSDRKEFTDLCASILANPANKTILAGVKDLELKDFGPTAINSLQGDEKTNRQKLQSLVMMASLYLWLTSKGAKEGTFKQVQDFAKNGLDEVTIDSKKTEVRLGEELEDKTGNVEEVEDAEEGEEGEGEEVAGQTTEEIGGTTYFLKKRTTEPGQEKLYDTQGKEVRTYTGTNRYGAYTNDSYNEEKKEQIGSDSYSINFIKHNNKRYKLTRTSDNLDGKYQEVGDVKQDKENTSNTTDTKENNEFLKNATVDKGTIYHGYDMTFDKTTGKLLIKKGSQTSAVTFTGTGWGYEDHKYGSATVGGEELSVHIYKKVNDPNSKNYTIDINPKVIRLDEQGLLNQKIAKDYTLTGQKITSKTSGVEVQNSVGNKITLPDTSSAYIFKYENPGTHVGKTLLPYDPSNPTLPDYQIHFPTKKVELKPGIHMLNRTEEVINLDGKFYKNVTGGVGFRKIYKEISATQTSAEEIQKQKEQEEKQQETEKSYDSLNAGLDTFGTELLGRGKLFDNVTFRGHLETFAKGSQEALKKGVKDVLGKNYYESKHPLKNIVDNFPGVITIKDGKPSFDLKKLKDDKGSLNEIGKQLKTLMTTLFSVVGDQFALLVTALEKDKGKIVGSDKEVENKFATVTTILSDVKTKITTGLSYLNNEGTFLMLLEHVNHLSSDTKAGASLENGLSGVKSSILTSSEKIYNNTESMLDTYSLINTFASGKVENMGPRMKKFLQETTPVTINGQTIYCNKKQLEKNKFKVEQDGKITKEGKPADQLLLDARKRGDIYGESVSQLVGTLYGNDNCTVLTKNKEDIRFKSDAEQKAWLEGLHLSKDSPLLGEIDNEKIVGSTNLTNYIKKHYQNDLPADEDRLVTRIESDTYPVVTLTDKLVSTPLPGKDTLVADLYKVKVIKGDSTDFVYVPKKTLEKSLKSYTEKLDTTDQAVVQESTLQEARDLMPDPLALFGQKYGIETKHWNTDPSKLNSILVGSGDSQFSIDIANGEKPTLVLPVTYGGFATTDVRVDCDAKTIKSSLDNATTLMDHYQKIVAYRKLSENNKDTYPRNTPQNNTMKFLEEQASALVKGSVDRVACEKYGFTPPSNKNTFSLADFARNNTNNNLVMQPSTHSTQKTTVA